MEVVRTGRGEPNCVWKGNKWKGRRKGKGGGRREEGGGGGKVREEGGGRRREEEEEEEGGGGRGGREAIHLKIQTRSLAVAHC